MIPTDFSVLLLAWDDADPGVAVLDGSTLPPTLPLVYQLAAQHPVLALYPHLPSPEATAALEASAPFNALPNPAISATPPAANVSGATPGPLDAPANAPGVHLLGAIAPASARPAMPAGGSRLVGLDDLQPAIQQALPTAHGLALAAGAAPGSGALPLAAASAATAARSQWPNHAGQQFAAGWLAPAAPYAGAAEAPGAGVPAPAAGLVREVFQLPPSAPLRPGPATGAAAAPSAAAQTPGAAVAPAIRATAVTSVSKAVMPLLAPAAFAPAPDTEAVVPAPFDEPVAEMGSAEASDLDATEDDLVPDATPPGAAPSAAEAARPPEPAATWAVRQPALDGLNFRMIQYARRAAQLVDGRHDFGVIYAPGWPAWLAALEICNRSGRPLVLYVPALASDSAPAAERGWLLGLERMALRRATLVLVPDAEALHQLRAGHAEALGEVRIVPAADEAAVQLVLAEVAQG